MAQRHVRIRLVREDGSPVPCITVRDGTRYAVACPGQVFALEAQVLPTLQFREGEIVTAYAYIDGKGVGESRVFYGPDVATWTGFAERLNDQKARHTKFQFAIPERAGPPPQTSAEWHARSGNDGEVTVKFQYSKLVPRKAYSSESGSELDSQPEERPAVPEWKKWWQVPGVTTAAVQAVIKKMPRSQIAVETVAPLATVGMRYERATILKCRNFLLPEKYPEHQALLEEEAAAYCKHAGAAAGEVEAAGAAEQAPVEQSHPPAKRPHAAASSGSEAPGAAALTPKGQLQLLGGSFSAGAGSLRRRHEPATEMCDLSDDSGPVWIPIKKHAGDGSKAAAAH